MPNVRRSFLLTAAGQFRNYTGFPVATIENFNRTDSELSLTERRVRM